MSTETDAQNALAASVSAAASATTAAEAATEAVEAFGDVSTSATAAAASATAASTSAAGAASAASTRLVEDDANPASTFRVQQDARLGKPSPRVFNVLGYGALGDGTTNDATAIHAARDAATAAGGGTVFFPYTAAGYRAGAIVAASNVNFVGENKVLLKRTGTSSAMFINVGVVSNVTIEGFTIDPAGLSTSSAVRVSTGASKATVRNNNFTDSGVAVANVDVQTGVSDVVVTDNSFYNTPILVGTGAVTFTAADDLATTPAAHGLTVGTVIQFGTITTTTGVTAGAYYFVKTVPSTTTFTFSTGSGGTTADLVGDGSAVGLSKANSLSNCIKLAGSSMRPIVARNIATGWRERFLYMLGTSGNATTGATIEHNRVTGLIPGGVSRQPITFQGVDDGLHVRPRVLNNYVEGPGESYDDTYLTGAADLISLHRCVDFIVAGNHTINGGDVGITIAMQSERGTVSGNISRGNDTVGFCIGSSTTTYTRRVAIAGNVCMNNGQARSAFVTRPFRSGIQLRNASYCSVTGNVLDDDQGLAPVLVGDGTVTFTDSGNIVTTPAPHGMIQGDAVTFATITTTTGVSAGVVYHLKTVPSATTFTLTTEPQGATTVDLVGNGSGTGLTERQGQHYGLTLVDSNNLQLVGNTSAGVSVGHTGITGTVTASGTSFFGATPTSRPAANPDTSGATLVNLETEVNQLKATLRTLGLLT